MRNHSLPAATCVLVSLLALAAAPAKQFLVICAPGSPGDTAQAQTTMDQLAAALAQTAGWGADSLGAVYYETASGGSQRLEQPDVSWALVSPPFYYEYARALSLVPRLEAVPASGEDTVYSLAARRGALKTPDQLADWEILGGIGFSTDFVRREVLGDWGEVPPATRISFSARPLTALRRAAAGEKVAVLLDPEQSAALSTLPFASSLEIVHASRPFPGGILCVVKGRLPESRAESLVAALQKLGSSEAGKAALQAIRVRKFRALDAGRLPSPAAGTPPGAPRP